MHRKISLCGIVVVMVGLLTSNPAADEASSGGCSRKCGDMDIPYPFGLKVVDGETSCYRDGAFALTCNHSFTPPKLFQGGIEVISVSLPAAKMSILLNMSHDCYSALEGSEGTTWNTELAYVYTFSHTDNVFTGVGCDTLAQIQGPLLQSFTGGCLSVCDSSSTIPDGECSGIGCCQAAVPNGLQQYNTSFGATSNHSRVLGFNPCSYSFLVQKGNYTFRKSDLRTMDKYRQFPVVLDWSIEDSLSCQEAVKNKTSYACISTDSVCLNSSSGVSYICHCSNGFQGNPYVVDGCQDIDECKHPDTYPCNGTCINYYGGYNCTCPKGFTGDPLRSGCQVSASSRFPIAIIIPVVAAVSLLTMCLGIWLYSLLQKRKVNELKERCFMQNGGRLLRRRISSRKEGEDDFKIFSKEDIERATNNYDPDFVIGRGGQGVVYKGILPNDKRTFAIKKSIVMDGSKIEEFINELVILSKINHKNIVKLVGCCLEVEDPLLVYEFVENGTLAEHIKCGYLSWNDRIRIATEGAGALAYLHSSANIPIIHRDVKSSNILLDKQYVAKVSDFGASKLVPIEQTQVHTVIMGTLGYLDPEYMLTHKLNEKSDVYSFGVVLVELLTGRPPISYEKTNVERCLSMHFNSCMNNGNIDEILDQRVLTKHTIGQMKEVAMLARHCLSMTGENRPQMIDIVMQLESLRRCKSYQFVSQNCTDDQRMMYEVGISGPEVEITPSNEESSIFNSGVKIRSLNMENGR